MVDVKLLKAVLERPAGCDAECVGRPTPPQWMLDAADYSTEMKCHRHLPEGIKARKG